MKARMEELQIFYDENIDDEKIQFFEKLRLKIKKALHNRPGKYQKNNQDHDNNFDGPEDIFDRAPLSQHADVAAWDTVGTPYNEKKQPLKEKNMISDMSVSSDVGPFDPSRPTELVFKVKLTADEYEMYLRERYTRLQQIQEKASKPNLR